MATPSPIPASRRYRQRFNDIGKTQGLTWTGDKNSTGFPEPDEIRLSAAFKKAHGWSRLNPTERAETVQSRIIGILNDVEARRRAAVAESLKRKYRAQYQFNYSISDLPQPLQDALPHFEAIGRLTEELRLLQLDPSGVALWDLVRERAGGGGQPESIPPDPDSLQVFERGYEGGCHRYLDDPFCDPVPTFPDLDPNTTMWPASIKDNAALTRLSQRADKDWLLSPFTVVDELAGQERLPLERRRLENLTYQNHPLFRGRLLRIAEAFDAIDLIPGFRTAEPEMAAAARKYAEAIRSGSGPHPFDDAEITWSKARANRLGFAWGPFEEVQDPHGVKRTFQFHLMLVRTAQQERMENYQRVVLQEMEDRLAGFVPGYLARQVSVSSVIQVYDVIARSGGMNSAGGEYMAEVLPNTGPVVKGGYRKKMIFANMNDGTFYNVLEPLAAQVIDPSQVGYVRAQYFTLESALHELSHSIGPLVDTLVSRDGKPVTVQTAMGPDLYGAIEEAKAEVGGIWMYAVLRAKGLIGPEEELAGYATYVASLVRQSRFGKKSPHGRGAKAVFGYLFKVGAIEIREVDITPHQREHRLHINFDRMPKAVEELVVQLATAQNQGSEALAQAYFADAERIPEEWDKFIVPRLEEVPRHIKLEVQAVRVPPPPPLKSEGTTERGDGCGCRLGARP